MHNFEVIHFYIYVSLFLCFVSAACIVRAYEVCVETRSVRPKLLGGFPVHLVFVASVEVFLSNFNFAPSVGQK